MKSALQIHYPGQLLASGAANHSKNPPTNGESFQFNEKFTIPSEVYALLRVSYRVEDWGYVELNGDCIIDLTYAKEGSSGSYGGHTEWGEEYSTIIIFGEHELFFSYDNINMSDPSINRIVCEYNFEAVELEYGGNKDKTPCACSASTCSVEGGLAVVAAADSESVAAGYATSSAGTAVAQLITEDSMVWSCNMGVLRGFGTMLSGKVQLESKELSAEPATPAALKFNHPMAARLVLPQGGITPCCRMEIEQGHRVIALRYYENGSIRPIGVDVAGGGMATLNCDADGTPVSLRWQDSTGAAWLFSATTGELLSYTGPELVTINATDIAAHLVIKRSAEDDSLRQIFSTWDGLLNVENITATGYRIALYSPAQVSGTDAGGFYTVLEGALPFKSFDIAYSADGGLSITEHAPLRQDYVCTWQQEPGGGWALTRGSVAEEQITTTKVRTQLEPPQYGSFDVWQLVTTVSKNGVAASCECEIFQSTPAGNLLLTRVEGFGSESARTTTYEYDGAGNVVRTTDASGLTEEHWYDSTGRIVKSFTPWRAGDYTLITDYSYVNTSATRYSDELATVTRKLRKVGTSTMLPLSTESHTYTTANGVKREEVRTTAAGSAHTQLRITETWTQDAPTPLCRGRIKMRQGIDGVQQCYEYAATTQHGALYTVTQESRVNGAALPGLSRRTVSYINAAGNTVREEEFALLSTGSWVLIDGDTHSYNVFNQRVGTLRDNGRSSSRDLTCTGDLLWEVDEDGVRTDYAYDSARTLTEVSRAEVLYNGTQITPETITEFARDAARRITTVTTHTGAMCTTRTTVYDLAGREVASTDELGRTTTTAYSADGLTTTVTTPAGATLITTTHPDGSTAHLHGTGQRELYYVYDLNGDNLRETVKLADATTVLSQSITNGFDQTLVQAQASAAGFIYQRAEFNALGQLTKSYADSGWNTPATAPTLYEYDAFGNVSKQTLALADSPTPQNSPVQLTAYATALMEDGVYQVTTRTRYNAEAQPLTTVQKQLISRTAPALEKKSVITNERGLTSTTYTLYTAPTVRTSYSSIPSSTITAQAVVADGFTLSQTDHAGVTTTATRTYTATGMVLVQTDGRGNATTTHTDVAGRTTAVTDAAGNTTTTAYHAHFDQPAMVTDALGNTACYQYDIRGRKTAEWGTAIQPVCYGYDSADRLTSLTTFRAGTEIISGNPASRADGDTTTWGYHDASGMEIRKTYADGKSITKTYDAFNRLLTETDGRGVTKTHSYEHARSLLLGTTYTNVTSPTTARAYTYNHLGQLLTVADAAGVRTFSYNTYGELAADSLLAGGKTHLVTELQDAYGRSAGYTYTKDDAVQQTLSTGYGTDGRIASAGFVHGGAQKLFTYAYLTGTHLQQTLTKPNNMSLTLSYEAQRDLLTGMVYKRSNTTVATRSYEYDTLGRPTSRSTAKDGITHSDVFHYTKRSELVNANLNGVQHCYDYDNIGNRRQAIEGSNYSQYTANNLNQYTDIYGSVNGQEFDFTPTFDDAGNQTLVKTSTGIWSVVYDAENRPISFTNAESATVVECTYDYMGRRATKKVTVNGAVTLHHRYLYRGYLQIACCDLTRSNHPCLWLITWDPTQAYATRPLAIQKDAT